MCVCVCVCARARVCVFTGQMKILQFQYMLCSTHAAAEVEFERTTYSVDEDAGFATLTVVSDIPAPVEFSVQVSFTDGTATC